MRIEEFINTTENWEEVLAGAPYFVKTKWDDNYFILKYNQLSSDFSNEIVCQCRGSIFYWDGSKAECVCRPFDKFFNVQEGNAAKIDWDSACVEEKIDGNFMKWWYHDGAWHLSTNGTIDAFKAQVGDLDLTFGDVFMRALGGFEPIVDLNKDYTHLFELTSPETRVVIPYEDGVYYLTSIHNESKEEYRFPLPDVKTVKTYPLSSLEECLDAAAGMDKDEEGFVVVDKYWHRIKVKSAGWLEAHYMANNGVITKKRVLKMLQANVIDDFLAMLPIYTDFVEILKNEIFRFETFLENSYYKLSQKYPKEEFYKHMSEIDQLARDFCFRKSKYPELTAHEYFFVKKTPSQILDLLDAYSLEVDY